MGNRKEFHHVVCVGEQMFNVQHVRRHFRSSRTLPIKTTSPLVPKDKGRISQQSDMAMSQVVGGQANEKQCRSKPVPLPVFFQPQYPSIVRPRFVLLPPIVAYLLNLSPLLQISRLPNWHQLAARIAVSKWRQLLQMYDEEWQSPPAFVSFQSAPNQKREEAGNSQVIAFA